jgi:hypothetical protein
MIGHAIETLIFREDIGAAVPACLDTVASACWVGFRLLPPPTPNLENVVLGCARLPQFRDARRSTLVREMRWHFRRRHVTAFHDRFSVTGWRERWESDSALRRTVMDHPTFEKWRDGLLDAVRRQPLVALAEEGSRSCYGAFGGDRRILSAMHSFMEEGGI